MSKKKAASMCPKNLELASSLWKIRFGSIFENPNQSQEFSEQLRKQMIRAYVQD